MEFDESAADGDAAVKWAGGSSPTLTTDANHVDILSFYWDADNEIAYGVATLDFSSNGIARMDRWEIYRI